jgi:hypothetical protein
VESRLSCVRIGIPITPNIVHTAKQAVKAHVVANSTKRFPIFDMCASGSSTELPGGTWIALQSATCGSLEYI